ncbi:MAG: glycogen/starch synthase [Candidatus Marinimicrobia bacterium]|nr:glycogen/starch synthase [Candidatus Neomarinimicrobiota bacterium]
MKVFLIAPEVAPFAETGIISEFSRNFPICMLEEKHDIRLIMPKYPFVSDRKYTLREVIRLREIPVEWDSETKISSIKSGFIPDSKVQVYFLQENEIFNGLDHRIYKRKGARKVIEGLDLRFSFFVKSALESLKFLHWQPELIQCCGWTSALVPLMLKTIYKDDPFYKDIKVVFSPFTSKEGSSYSAECLEFAKINVDQELSEDLLIDKKGRFSSFHAGIKYSDSTIVFSNNKENVMKGLKSNTNLSKILKEKKNQISSIKIKSDKLDQYVNLSTEVLEVYKSVVS